MWKTTKHGAKVGGSDLSPDEQRQTERLIELFENRLEFIASQNATSRRHIRPLVPGSVLAGVYEDIVFVGYVPQLGIPTVAISKLSLTGPNDPTISGFYNFAIGATGQDMCVVELRKHWLTLDNATRNATLDAAARQVVQSELSRVTMENSAMIPFNPVFGPNRFLIQERLVFVLMPFDRALTETYNAVVKPLVDSKNLICRRADDFNTNNAIMSDIWKSICESRFIIADLSLENPNVMYELGICHTIGKETILIRQGADEGKFPFDVAHLRIIAYPDTAAGGTVLRDKLGGAIDSVLTKLSGQQKFA